MNKEYTIILSRKEIELIIYILDQKSEEICNFDDEEDSVQVDILSEKLYKLIK